jgi:hypothetical protein
MPLADGLVSAGQLGRPDPSFPLEVAFCPACSLVQIIETVPPEVLFCRDYPYYSSISEHWVNHCRENALGLIDRCGLDGKSLVVELASNDGYLLRNFAERGIPVLGIDPAEGPAEAARRIGVPTLCEFFTREMAERLCDERGQADLIVANNVLAHVADTNGFVAGILLRLLGVDEPTVLDDYMLSNAVRRGWIAEREDEHRLRIAESLGVPHDEVPETRLEASRALLNCDRHFLKAALDAVHDRWGSWEAFRRDGLGLDDGRFAAYREALLG